MNLHPAIVNPVVRFIGVADAARATAFYRDVLGFEVRKHEVAIEAVCGPARIFIGAEDYAPDNHEVRPQGSAMLFFQTGNAAEMRAAIHNRGGNPRELEKVNFIRMLMFEIRDPDGQILWFAQSYAEP